MDLETPTELLLTPSVSFSTSVSSSASDVFSLLLTQLHQCHTQRVTELEQKVNYLNKRYQKWILISKEQKEIALKYRQNCQDLKKENHALKKELKEANNRKHHKAHHPGFPAELQVSKEDQNGNGRKSSTKYSDTQDFIEPEKSASSKLPSGNSKLSRVKKKNRKVRYEEVSVPPKDDVILTSNSSPKKEEEEEANDPLFVPETIDPDLDMVDEDDDGDLSSSQNLAETHSSVQKEKEQLLLKKEKVDSSKENCRLRDDSEADGPKVEDEQKPVAASQHDLEETHLPSLYDIKREQNVQEVENNEHSSSGSDVKPKDASTPVDARKLSSFSGSPLLSMDGMAMSPVILDENDLDQDFSKIEQEAKLETEKQVESSNTQMSPTFVGGHGLPTYSQSSVQSSALPSLPKMWTPKDKSVSRTLDGTGESEASFLLLPQNVSPSPKVVSSSVAKKSPSKSKILSRASKRKVSPDQRPSKVLKVSDGKIFLKKKPGIIRQFTSNRDARSLEELKRLKQSTLSQHLKPVSDTRQKVTLPKESIENSFKIPNVPGKIRTDESHVIRDGEHAETNVGISLNGSIDPIISLDEYDGDIEPLQYISSPVAKDSASCVDDTEFVAKNTKKKATENGKITSHSPVADKSDVMFDDSFPVEEDDGKNKSLNECENDLDERQILARKFDRVPNREERPQYKYKEVVRKHNEREQLKGFDCKQCAEFYNGMGLTDSQKEERMKVCSRHRGRYTPPSTPEHYWSIGFPDTQTCLKRGYIQEDVNSKVDAEVMPRRRNKLKQLFPKKEEKNG